MRSYAYAEGKWTPVKDTLPPTLRRPSFGSKSYDAYERYVNALKHLGFSEYGRDSLHSRLGAVTIRSRDHAKLPLERAATETYDFLCELEVAGSFIRVWIDDLPTINLFLADIQAQREPERDESIATFLRSEELSEALSSIHSALNAIWMGDLEVTIKAPKSKAPGPR